MARLPRFTLGADLLAIAATAVGLSLFAEVARSEAPGAAVIVVTAVLLTGTGLAALWRFSAADYLLQLAFAFGLAMTASRTKLVIRPAPLFLGMLILDGLMMTIAARMKGGPVRTRLFRVAACLFVSLLNILATVLLLLLLLALVLLLLSL